MPPASKELFDIALNVLSSWWQLFVLTHQPLALISTAIGWFLHRRFRLVSRLAGALLFMSWAMLFPVIFYRLPMQPSAVDYMVTLKIFFETIALTVANAGLAAGTITIAILFLPQFGSLTLYSVVRFHQSERYVLFAAKRRERRDLSRWRRAMRSFEDKEQRRRFQLDLDARKRLAHQVAPAFF